MTEVDDMGQFVQVWDCENPPEQGATFRVLEDEWDYTGERPVRVIKRFELVDA